MYIHQPYPSVRYHRSGTTLVVRSTAEHDELMATGEWADSPAAFDAEPEAAEPDAPAAAPKKRKR